MAVVALIFKIIGIVLLSLIALLVVLLHFSVVAKVHVGGDGVSYSVKYCGFTIMPRKKKSKKTDNIDKPPDDDNDDIDEEIDDLDLDDDDLEEEVEQLEAESAEDISGADDLPDADETVQSVDLKKPAAAETAEEEKITDDVSEEKIEKTTEKKAEKKKTEKSEKTDSGKSSGRLRAKIDGYKRKYEKIKPYIPYTWRMFKKLLKTVRISVDDVRMIIGREDAHEAAVYYGGLQAVISNLLTTLCGMFSLKVKKCDVSCRFAENYFNGSGDISVRVRPSTVIAIVLCIAVNAGVIFIGQKLAARKAAKAAAESV